LKMIVVAKYCIANFSKPHVYDRAEKILRILWKAKKTSGFLTKLE